MELTTERVKKYAQGLGFKKSQQLKVQKALTVYKEHCERLDLTEGTEESIASFETQNPKKWQDVGTYANYVREYYGLPKPKRKSKNKKGAEQLSVDMKDTIAVSSNETTVMSESETLQSEEMQGENVAEYQEENSQGETLQHSTTKRARKSNTTKLTASGKRQISVYVSPEVYDDLDVMAQTNGVSIGVLLGDYAIESVKENAEMIDTARRALQALRSTQFNRPKWGK